MKVNNTYIIVGADMGKPARRIYYLVEKRRPIWYIDNWATDGLYLGLTRISALEANKLINA